jgi:adenine-specific DNA-methyltransferase
MSQNYEKLKNLLKELFQLDQPDLDFGLYRIMHAKSAEVSQFLDKDLLPQVKAAFGQYKTADKAAMEQELAKLIAGIESAGMDPAQSPKVVDLRARLKTDSVDIDALEREVYDHLFSFFRRYYDQGDFLAKRVYKPGVYAIPYEGEEVTFHWANKDQYYIKTSEYLRDYAFRLRPDDDKRPMRVHFRLVDAAEGEHGNVKAVQGRERRFRLLQDGALAIEGGELLVRFTYQPDEKKQKELNAASEAAILATTESHLTEWLDELRRPHRRADGSEAGTRLRVHLDRYAARNTFDYFIHKDLGTFLRRELDFYIKNEVMHLDDVENESAPRVEQYLSKIKVIRRIAIKVIAFLAQLEEFQKKLWLKKKFVVETQYCIAVSSIPNAFYPEIAANEAQHEEWITLLAIDEIGGNLMALGYSKKLKSEFLKAHPTLVVDTRHFEASFTARLLDALGDVEEKTSGLLVHGENFQALSLMHRRYRERVKCIYIDPPYNTGDDGFSYRDNYQHSSWVSFVSDRVAMLRQLLRSDGAFFGSIDDREVQSFRWLLDEVFGRQGFVSDIAVINNWKGRQDREHIATAHEHLMLYEMPAFESLGFSLSEAQIADYDQEDGDGERYQLRDLRKRGGADTRQLRANLYFPIYWDEDGRTAALFRRSANDVEICPFKSDGVEGCWRWKSDTVLDNLDILEARQVAESGRWNIFYRIYLEHNGETRTAKPKSVWAGTKYSSDRAIKTLRSLLPNTAFKSPKAVGLIQDVICHSSCDDDLVLDVFAGSGTSAHATIAANRCDRGQRAIILVEQSDDFYKVLLPRIKKVTFTPEWKDGKPKRLATGEEAEYSPRIVKIVRLESYEDALNNLETRRVDRQQLLLATAEAQGADGLNEQYILRYMLDVETRGSQSLLNVQAFTDPTAYKLKVKRPGSDESREINVDLLETFNWLIGLTIRHIAAPQAFSAAFQRDAEKRLCLKGRLRQEPDGPHWFRTVTGTTPDGRRTLVIWRKLTGEPEQDNLVLDEWFTKQGYSAKDSEFDLIYVNGGNNLENLKTPDDLWKVRLIEEDFHRLMFETDGA